jgi:purine-binding chemotaxis protein CheW
MMSVLSFREKSGLAASRRHLPDGLLQGKLMGDPMRNQALFCKVATRLCALPCADIAEIMRRLPIDRVAGAPRFVPGVSIIRGVATPVVDLAILLGSDSSEPAYFVTVALPGRQVALGVDAVLGVRPVVVDKHGALPPLLTGAAPDFVSTMRALDNELLLVLGGVLDVPADVEDVAS